MKSLYRILFYVMCVVPSIAGAAPVATTAGSNLTAYNTNTMASVTSNQWNSLMNNRTGVTTGPTADLGNCNAVIMRCAQPKCASGGCTSMDVTIPIVELCIKDNASCSKYANDLIQPVAAQIVANANAKASANASAAASASAEAAAAQASQQIAQMQQQMNMQMQQMQQTMQAQNDATVAQLQAALEEQKQMTAAAQQQVADAQIAQNAQQASGLTAAQEEAAARGIDSDVILREQVTGQIMSKLENAETALKALEATMKDAFTYAGCDSKGNNCAGPKRVKVFKQKAMAFFEPYNDVLDELYDALITAQAVGVDITDIYMMLNGSCNVWGEYLCTGAVEIMNEDGKFSGLYKWPTYDENSCPNNGGKSEPYGVVIGGHECYQDGVVPPEDSRNCTLNRTFTTADEQDDLKRDWLEVKSADNTIRIGCASSALENSAFFRNRKKQASIDIETLERIIEQDAPATISRYARNKDTDDALERFKYCAVGSGAYMDLQKWVATKKLPSKICMTNSAIMNQVMNDGVLTVSGERALARADADEKYRQCAENLNLTDCTKVDGTISDYAKPYGGDSGDNKSGCCIPTDAIMCLAYGDGESWTKTDGCKCKNSNKTYRAEHSRCMTNDEYCKKTKQMPKGDNACYSDCDAYCIASAANGPCSNKEKDKCDAKWDDNQEKCMCELKR